MCGGKGECQRGLRMPWLPEALYIVRQHMNRVEAGKEEGAAAIEQMCSLPVLPFLPLM